MGLLIFKPMKVEAQRAFAAAVLECRTVELAHYEAPVQVTFWGGRNVSVRFYEEAWQGHRWSVTGLMSEAGMNAAIEAGAELLAIISNRITLSTNRLFLGKVEHTDQFDIGKWWAEHPLLDAPGPWMKWRKNK